MDEDTKLAIDEWIGSIRTAQTTLRSNLNGGLGGGTEEMDARTAAYDMLQDAFWGARSDDFGTRVDVYRGGKVRATVALDPLDAVVPGYPRGIGEEDGYPWQPEDQPLVEWAIAELEAVGRGVL